MWQSWETALPQIQLLSNDILTLGLVEARGLTVFANPEGSASYGKELKSHTEMDKNA